MPPKDKGILLFHGGNSGLYRSSHTVRIMSMVWCEKDVTQLLMHWSYVFLALTQPCLLMLYCFFILGYLHAWITLHHLSASYILSHNLFGSFVSVDHPTWPRESAKHRVRTLALLLGFVRTRVLMSRSRLNNGATHGGWHFDIHRDFDTRGR